MSQSEHAASEEVPPPVLRWIDGIADSFEDAWKKGTAPRIEEYLEGTGPDRDRLLLELVKIDLHYHWKAGTPRYLDHYERAYAALAALGSADRQELIRYLARLAEQYCPAATGPAGASESAPGVGVLQPIGKYLTVKALGSGAQADVFQALDTQLGRSVVIKLSRAAGGKEEHARVLDEGRKLAALDHPHLARVYDCGEHDGRLFLVMQDVKGRNLEQYRAAGRPTPHAAAALLAKIARALGKVHAAGLIHRDVKPANLLVDEQGEPRVIDFGLALQRDVWRDEPDPPSTVCGTPEYMAPEQARGETGRVAARSDLFGLGAVLYFLLTGSPPYPDLDRRKALEKAQECNFNRQALRNADVPARLQAICLRAMAKNPDDRYASADDLAAALERFAHGPRLGLWLGAAGLAVLLTVLLLGLWGKPVSNMFQSVGGEVEPPPRRLDLVVEVRRPAPGKRGDDWFELRHVLPVKVGELLKMRAAAPARHHLSVFSADHQGHLRLVRQVEPSDRDAKLEYPAAGGALRLEKPAGTLLLLVCGRRTGAIEEEHVLRLWEETKSKWPAVPLTKMLRLTRDKVEAEGGDRDFSRETVWLDALDDPEGNVRRRLDAFRQRARSQFSCLEGLAFAHGE